MSAAKSAAQEIEDIKSQKELRYEILYVHLKRYILFRFLLDDESCGTDDLIELANRSIARSLNINEKDVADLDLSHSCTGSSSAVTRKILLLMALEKALDIEIQPEESALITSVADLAELVFTKMKK